LAHGRGIPEAARITECEECGAVIPATRRFCDQDCINTNRRREASP
jgi:predicted nucleic acid-binding Zn ribbon protein